MLCGVAEGPLGLGAEMFVGLIPLNALSTLLQQVFIAEVLHLSGTQGLLFKGAEDCDGAPRAYRFVGPTVGSSMYEGWERHGFYVNGSKCSIDFRRRNTCKEGCGPIVANCRGVCRLAARDRR
jgi:hypothetical protein